MHYWKYEDEFIQHDREQLYKKAWPTPEERKENYEYQHWLDRQSKFNERKLEELGKPIITGTPSGSNEFYNMWVLYQGGNFNTPSFQFKNKE